MPKPPPIGYTVKFEGFIRMCEEAKQTELQQLVVAHVSVIGVSGWRPLFGEKPICE